MVRVVQFMVVFPLQQYINRVYAGSVQNFANAVDLSASMVYRYLRENSRMVVFISGKPTLCTIGISLPPLPYSVTFDIYHNYVLMFSYDGLDYFVSKRYNKHDQLVYTLNTIGDVPPALLFDYEVNDDIGLHRFSFSDLFEVIFEDLGSHWISPSTRTYRVLDASGADLKCGRWESLKDAYSFAQQSRASLYLGDSLLYRGDLD